MINREKVMKGLECCIKRNPDDNPRCGECPYDGACLNRLKIDALELLEEQDQPTRPVFNGRFWECEKCGEMYQDILEVRKYRHCPWCGRRIEWQG